MVTIEINKERQDEYEIPWKLFIIVVSPLTQKNNDPFS